MLASLRGEAIEKATPHPWGQQQTSFIDHAPAIPGHPPPHTGGSSERAEGKASKRARRARGQRVREGKSGGGPGERVKERRASERVNQNGTLAYRAHKNPYLVFAQQKLGIEGAFRPAVLPHKAKHKPKGQSLCGIRESLKTHSSEML